MQAVIIESKSYTNTSVTCLKLNRYGWAHSEDLADIGSGEVSGDLTMHDIRTWVYKARGLKRERTP